MTEDRAKDETARSRRWIRWALGVSLALNLAVVGVVGGVWWRNAGMAHHGAPGGDLTFGSWSRALSAQDRLSMRDHIFRERPALARMMQAERADREALLVALRADAFDPTAVAPIMERMSSRSSARIELGQRLVLKRISDMSVAERRAFADRLEANQRRRPSVDRDRSGDVRYPDRRSPSADR